MIRAFEQCLPVQSDFFAQPATDRKPPDIMSRMTSRKIDAADRFFGEAERVLRTLSGGNSPSTRARPAPKDQETLELEQSERDVAVRLMRINHAGEVAAQALYQGQALTARLDDVRDEMRQAASEEVDHLAWCEERLDELGGQPSLLTPLWYAGSFAIGAAAGIAGDRWSLGFVAETEAQVVSHLNSHIERLPDKDHASRAILERMREDEERHGNAARDAGGLPLPEPLQRVMQAVSRVMTRTAYWF